MHGGVGTWDFDIATGVLTVGPDGALPVEVGSPDADLSLTQLRNFIHSDDVGGLEDAVVAWIEGRSIVLRHRFRLRMCNSHWVWIEATGRKNGDGRTLSGVWADVSEAEAERARKAEAVARVHQFAAAASHDLIGPLRHIAMYGDLLVGDFGTGATQEKRRMLEAITDKARALQVLTKRMIAFSTGTAAPEFVAVPLDHTFVRLRDRLADEIDEAGAEIDVGSLAVVHGDPVLIEKVFESLLRNALEWRAERTLNVRVEALIEGQSVLVTFSDNALGIDARYAGRIFDAFWSLPRPGGRKGAGLGLAVCKTILDALGGDIALRSTSSDGSMFEVVLPLWK
jgi:light-regulated signal transduction histidine kinase (bacteriophytochrome)